MHKTEQLSEHLEQMLHEFGEKKDLTPQELESVYKASKSLYYLTVTKEMIDHDEDGYSQRRYMGSNDGYYKSHIMDNMSSNRRYSRNSEKDIMIDKLHDMLEDAVSESERETIQRCINKINKS